MSLIKARPRTAAQRATSRANGRKSAGPKTLCGKRIVALNALKHGGWAETTRPLWHWPGAKAPELKNDSALPL